MNTEQVTGTSALSRSTASGNRVSTVKAEASRGQSSTTAASTGEASEDRGRSAKKPSEIPSRGWKDIAWRLWEKFNKERPRLAEHVWAEFKQTNSANCRVCHKFTPEVIAKQQEFLQPMHKQAMSGEATCIDCHKGIAHKAP